MVVTAGAAVVAVSRGRRRGALPSADRGGALQSISSVPPFPLKARFSSSTSLKALPTAAELGFCRSGDRGLETFPAVAELLTLGGVEGPPGFVILEGAGPLLGGQALPPAPNDLSSAQSRAGAAAPNGGRPPGRSKIFGAALKGFSFLGRSAVLRPGRLVRCPSASPST